MATRVLSFSLLWNSSDVWKAELSHFVMCCGVLGICLLFITKRNALVARSCHESQEAAYLELKSHLIRKEAFLCGIEVESVCSGTWEGEGSGMVVCHLDSFHCTLQSTWPAGLPTLCPSSTGKWQKSVNLLNTGRWRILKDERECSILFHLWHHSHISSGLQCWTEGSHCASLVDTKAHSTGALHIPSDWCWCHGSRNGHGRDGKAPYKENGGNRKERRVSKTERETICLVWNANAIQHAPWLVFWPQTLPGGRGNENVHQVVSGQWGLTGRIPVGLTLRWTADSWGPASAPRKPDSSEVQKVTKWHNPWKEQGWSFSSWSLLEDQQDIGGGENLEQSKHASYL